MEKEQKDVLQEDSAPRKRKNPWRVVLIVLLCLVLLLGALVGAGFSEIMGRLTKVPVPIYLVPCVIPLVPGGGLYETMFNFVAGNYAAAATAGMRTLQIALGIAGGIVIASVLGIIFRPKMFRRKKR